MATIAAHHNANTSTTVDPTQLEAIGDFDSSAMHEAASDYNARLVQRLDDFSADLGAKVAHNYARVTKSGTAIQLGWAMTLATAEKLLRHQLPELAPLGDQPVDDATALRIRPQGEACERTRGLDEAFRALAGKLGVLSFEPPLPRVLSSIPQPFPFSPSVVSPESPAWLAEAMQLDEREDVAGALDVLFRQIDTMLSAGRFNEVDEIILRIPFEGPSLSFLMGVLSITRAGALRLRNRQTFFNRLYRLCKSFGRNAEELLGGLRERSGTDGSGLSGS